MTDVALTAGASPKPKLDHPIAPTTAILFVTILFAGILYAGLNIYLEVRDAGAITESWLPFVLLGIALFIALGFEFVNGFHDTANAVATVIYTHSLAPNVAVLWSGLWNFLGVMVSSGAVAFVIISLLPVELILQVGSHAGFAMVFALLFAAIIWNLGTWWLGLPASSSHTLIGSIIGVGIANALMQGRDGTAGVDWSQAVNVGYALLLSPIIGFICAALLLLTLKYLVHKPSLYQEPKGATPPPLWIRAILVLTCTGVSFAHGSNDGQKGMGLIMLILIGCVPTAYALNRAMPDSRVEQFHVLGAAAQTALQKLASGAPPADSRAAVTTCIRTKQLQPDTIPAVAELVGEIDAQVTEYGTLRRIPTAAVNNVRNDMYLVSEAIRVIMNTRMPPLDAQTRQSLVAYKGELDDATKYIPLWVKVSVAIALGLGTMIGWKRIVVTVGEKIGKSHLTYAQGASAELVAMATIAGADMFGLPVSTTQVLSSGVAGTMAANGSGLQMATVRNLLMAWVLTLPMAVLLSGSLYWLLSHI
jgi:inorganic phosphate transporter, PiT family